jgi:hypothetical protein
MYHCRCKCRKFNLIYKKIRTIFISLNKFIKKTKFKDLSNNTNYIPQILIFFNIYLIKFIFRKTKTIYI